MKLPRASENTMSRHLSKMALLATLAAAAACSSGNNATGTGGTGGSGGAGGSAGAAGAAGMGGMAGAGGGIVAPSCASGQPWSIMDGVCAPTGFPFAQYALATSTECPTSSFACPTAGTTIHLSQPADGTLCLSGTDSSTGLSSVLLGFTVFSAAGATATNENVLTRFNANLLGITQVKFTIDRPPAAGVTFWANSIVSDTCPNGSCFSGASTLPTPIVSTGTDASVATTTVSFADLVSSPPGMLETRALATLGFDVGPGDFDFCVHDLQFLDASGAVVSPKP
jgi:hypothetical protein